MAGGLLGIGLLPPDVVAAMPNQTIDSPVWSVNSVCRHRQTIDQTLRRKVGYRGEFRKHHLDMESPPKPYAACVAYVGVFSWAVEEIP